MNGQTIVPFIKLALVLFFILILGFVITFVINAIFPNSNLFSSTFKSMLNNGLGIIDKSFLFGLIVVMLIDIFYSWEAPNSSKGIINLGGLFFVIYLSLFFKAQFSWINKAFTWNTLMPSTYVLFNDNYYLAILFFSLILCVVFNFRKKELK